MPTPETDLPGPAANGADSHTDSPPSPPPPDLDLAAQDEQEGGSDVEVFQFIRELEAHLQDAYALTAALTKDRDDLDAEAARSREACEELKRRNRYLVDKIPDLDVLRDELEFAEQERSRAQTKVTAMSAEMEMRKQDDEAKTAALELATTNLKEARAAIVRFEFEVSQLQDLTRDLRLSEQKLGEELRRVAGEKRALEVAKEEAVARIESLQAALQESLGAQEDLEERLNGARETADRLREEVEQRVKRNDELSGENRGLRAYGASLEREIEKLKPQLARVEESLTATRAEKERLEGDLLSRRKTMKEIHSALAGTKAKTFPSDRAQG